MLMLLNAREMSISQVLRYLSQRLSMRKRVVHSITAATARLVHSKHLLIPDMVFINWELGLILNKVWSSRVWWRLLRAWVKVMMWGRVFIPWGLLQVWAVFDMRRVLLLIMRIPVASYLRQLRGTTLLKRIELLRIKGCKLLTVSRRLKVILESCTSFWRGSAWYHLILRLRMILVQRLEWIRLLLRVHVTMSFLVIRSHHHSIIMSFLCLLLL